MGVALNAHSRPSSVAWLLPACAFAACGARTELNATPKAGDASAADVLEEDSSVVRDCPPAPTPVLLASGVGKPYDTVLALDDAFVYMSDAQVVTRFPKCAPGEKQALTGAEANPGRIVVDQGTVYFVDITLGGSVRSVATTGGTITTLATAPPMQEPMSVQRVGSELYYLFSDGVIKGSIYSMPAGGGAPFLIGPAIGDTIATDGVDIYFMNYFPPGPKPTPMVVSRSVHGGPDTPLAGSYYDGSVAISPSTVYFTGWGLAPSFVKSVSRAGGPVTTIATNEPVAVYVTVGGGYVYWLDQGGEVKRAPLGGGSVETVVSTNVAGIGLDGSSLYYSTTSGELYRVDE